MLKIKPCPFCGSEARLQRKDTGTFSYVSCTNNDCQATTKGVWISTQFSSDDKAIEIWNKRVNDFD